MTAVPVDDQPNSSPTGLAAWLAMLVYFLRLTCLTSPHSMHHAYAAILMGDQALPCKSSNAALVGLCIALLPGILIFSVYNFHSVISFSGFFLQ
jgi:hypothetical protein